jgi:hypothetical protein
MEPTTTTSNSPSPAIQCGAEALAFYETLIQTLPVRNVSDRTCFRRITAWLRREVEAGRRPPEVFREVLLFARESRLPGVRNPNAVFLSILKKELHYDPKSQ